MWFYAVISILVLQNGPISLCLSTETENPNPHEKQLKILEPSSQKWKEVGVSVKPGEETGAKGGEATFGDLKALSEEMKGLAEEIRRLRDEVKASQKAIESLIEERSLYKRERPQDCSDLLIDDITESGVYEIFPNEAGNPVSVYCDMEMDGGGWTVFFRRNISDENATDFNGNWTEYKTGFGKLNEDFWLGNDILHNLTRARPFALAVDASTPAFSGIDDDGEFLSGRWNSFEVDSEEKNFRLSVAHFDKKSSISNLFFYLPNNSFSTFDKDNDRNENENCASANGGGWWYNSCELGTRFIPTGSFYSDARDLHRFPEVMFYERYTPSGSILRYTIKKLQMKIRPQIYSSLMSIAKVIRKNFYFGRNPN